MRMVRLGILPKQEVHRNFFRGRKPFCRMTKRPSGRPSGYNGAVEYVLRDFQAEDFEVLWRIDQRCFVPGIAYSRPELSAYIRRRGSFTVVARALAANGSHAGAGTGDASGIVGFIVAEANRRGVGHIISIDVLPENQRGGLGSKLLATAEERLRVADCHTVVLETAVDNTAALAFYKRHQYSVAKIAPRYYSSGVDAFVLEKDLLAEQGR
jgi:ribosomal-protein-alanine N-acetyltransferase